MGKDSIVEHRRFAYKELADLQEDLAACNLELPLSDEIALLGQPLSIGTGQAPNRLAVLPMEGCDGTAAGSPADLTWRRYERFASGGAGVLWVEATAVVAAGRANPRQLWLQEDNLADFSRLVDLINKNAAQKPYQILQLTHSGRYSRPSDRPMPQVAVANPWLDKAGQELEILTDEQLADLVPAYVQAARLAHAAGFQAVDIKACHRYLLNEMLSAHTRPGQYGTSLANRSRLLLDLVKAVKAAVPIDIAVRLNAYDEIPYPFGWGVSQTDHHLPDLAEPAWLVDQLYQAGVALICITGGNPYYNPHVNRPYDTGPYKPAQHQLYHALKLYQACRDLKAGQKALPGQAPLRFMLSGLSWLRQFGGQAAAGLLKEGWTDLAGFGRQAFAYPDFARDLLEKGQLDSRKSCIACGKCSEIMRDGGKSGCVIQDKAVYLPLYQAGRQGKPALVGRHLAEHV